MNQAERFREARTAAGLTQRDLSARIGYTNSVVARIESGARHPNIAQATAIAEALDAPHLLEGVPDAEMAERLRRARVSAGKRGKPRPDASKRMARLHAELRVQADRARGDLLDVDELATARGISRNAVVARVCVGKLRGVPVAGAVTLNGRPRMFFARDVDWSARGSHPASLRALFSTHIGPIRQKALGRWFGARAGRLGGRPTADLTDEQRDKVLHLAAQGWGRRAIANRLSVSEWTIRKALDS
jgi:transcriptional regulator with XRE-family HTH domain